MATYRPSSFQYQVPKTHQTQSFQQSQIFQGPRDESFKIFINNILKEYGNISEKHRDEILDKEGMSIYSTAFTSPSFNNVDNYQFLEILGDSTLNKSIIWYLSRRFPFINTPDGIDILTRLKIKYIQKKSFASISEKLGFWSFISTNFNRNIQEDVTNTLEDVLESFFGATEMIIDKKYKSGTGYKICYKIISKLLDKINISINYEELVDAKTRLKELIDHNKHKGIGIIEYIKFDQGNSSIKHIPEKGQPVIIASGKSHKYEEAEQIAASKALDILKGQGFIKSIPDEYNKYCS
jgi:dsRNA-specific ribonuclease